MPTIVFGRSEFAALAQDAAALRAQHPDADRHYVELLRAAPTADVAAQLEGASAGAMDVVVRDRAVHTFFLAGAPLGGPGGAKIARLIGVSTNRNATVIRAVAQRWC